MQAAQDLASPLARAASSDWVRFSAFYHSVPYCSIERPGSCSTTVLCYGLFDHTIGRARRPPSQDREARALFFGVLGKLRAEQPLPSEEPMAPVDPFVEFSPAAPSPPLMPTIAEVTAEEVLDATPVCQLSACSEVHLHPPTPSLVSRILLPPSRTYSLVSVGIARERTH